MALEPTPDHCILAYISGHSVSPRGRAAFAVTLRRFVHGKLEKEVTHVVHAADSTLAEREVAALLFLLNCLRLDEPLPVIVRNDYAYTLDSVTKWMEGWKARGWKTSDGKPIKHLDMWMKIDARLKALAPVDLSFQLVPKNSDDALNVEVTELAKKAVAA